MLYASLFYLVNPDEHKKFNETIAKLWFDWVFLCSTEVSGNKVINYDGAHYRELEMYMVNSSYDDIEVS